MFIISTAHAQCAKKVRACLITMEERPQLAELQNQVITNKWFDLGLQLGLTDNDLKEIQQNYSAISDCRREMFSLWLNTFPGACRNHIIEGLKTISVGEILIAERYTLFISQSSLCMCKLFNHCICKWYPM